MNLPKGQNTLLPGPKCPFVTVKRTKHAASGSKMSFWSCHTDKTRCFRAWNVLLNLPPKAQKESRLGLKCLYEAVKRTKQNITPMKDNLTVHFCLSWKICASWFSFYCWCAFTAAWASNWIFQLDKTRSGSGAFVQLDPPIGQSFRRTRAFCLIGSSN